MTQVRDGRDEPSRKDFGLTRRTALAVAALGGAGVVGASLGMRQRRVAAQGSVGSGGGIAGGGMIEGPDAAVQFSIFATRIPIGEEEDEVVISGRVQFADPVQGWRMESVAVTEYGSIEDDEENARQILGTMRVTTAEDEAEYPFAIRVVDAGRPADELDTLELAVGAAVDGEAAGENDDDAFSYVLSGTVSAGDIQLVEIALAAEED